LLVDIGGGTSDIAIFSKGSISYSSAIPVGGNHVTRDISVGLRTSFEAAEQIKIESGIAMEELANEDEIVRVPGLGVGEPRKVPRYLLGQIIQPRVEELFHLVARELEKSGCEQQVAAGAIISGGGSQLPGTAQLAERVLEIPVRIGKPTRNLIGMTDSVSSPIFATGVGLVQYGARYPREEVPLITASGMFLSRFWERVCRLFHAEN